MPTSRRWLQFSLRGFLIVLTIGCLALGWLGWKLDRAQEQREAVKAIKATAGWVRYDWEPDPFHPGRQQPPEPAWLRRLLGHHFFRTVEEAGFRTKPDLQEIVPHLKRLPKLQTVTVPDWLPSVTVRELKAALPNCEVELDRPPYF